MQEPSQVLQKLVLKLPSYHINYNVTNLTEMPHITVATYANLLLLQKQQKQEQEQQEQKLLN